MVCGHTAEVAATHDRKRRSTTYPPGSELMNTRSPTRGGQAGALAPARESAAALAGATARSRDRLFQAARDAIPGKRLSETLPLLRVARPPAPYGARSLARCYSIEDVARKARIRLPRGARAYLDGGGEGEYTLRHKRAAFDRVEFLPDMPRDA